MQTLLLVLFLTVFPASMASQQAHRALVQVNKRNFAPRIGIAYSYSPKTVVRAGYGIYYMLFERFGSEDKCHAYLEELRWPKGVECPRCQSKKISRIKARRQFDCDGCRYQFSVRVGTLFHDRRRRGNNGTRGGSDGRRGRRSRGRNFDSR